MIRLVQVYDTCQDAVCKRCAMVAPLDIFAVNNGESKWLGCAESIAQAIDLIRKTGSGSYFVFSQQTGHKSF